MTATATCSTCKHWAEPSTQFDTDNPEHGLCQRLPEQDDAEARGSLAFTSETSGINGSWLRTRAEFGCVLYEVKA